MVVRVTPVSLTKGGQYAEGYEFLARLAKAEDQGRFADSELASAMLKRGSQRHTPRRGTLDDLPGEWN